MRKFDFLFLLILLPCLALAQNLVPMDVTVKRIPVSHTCSRQTVWLLTAEDRFYLQSNEDTLKLRRLQQPVYHTDKTEVLFEDELHNGQVYTVKYMESDSTIAWRVSPVTKHLVSTVGLYALIISSSKKCKHAITKH